MEVSTATMLCASMVLLYVTSALTLPLERSEEEDHMVDKRPKYMDTRDIDAFTQLTWVALRRLAEDGKLNPDLISIASEDESDSKEVESKEENRTSKRGHLRICLRRSGSHFIPYPCFRRG